MESEASDFVISFQRSPEIRHIAPQINSLFRVRLEFSNAKPTRVSGSEWVKIFGTKDAIDKTKEFLKGIDNPEARMQFSIPDDIVASGSWRQEYIWRLQQQYGVVIMNVSPTQLWLQGSALVVQQSLSLLEEYVRMIRQTAFGQAYYGTPNSPYYQGYYHPAPSEKLDGHLPYVQQDIISRGAPQISRSSIQGLNENYQATIESTVPKGAVPQKSPTEPNRTLNHPNYQQLVSSQLREYASKLDYTDEEIQTALTKCLSTSASQVVDENALLQQLIALYPCKKPAFGSQTDKKDGFSIQQQVSNLQNPPKSETSTQVKRTVKKDGCSISSMSSDLRPIVVDGSNVAMSHGNRDVFSCKGIQICVDYFKKRGHEDITVFVPQWRKEASKPDRPIVDQHILLELEKDQILSFTPSRRVNGQRVVCYDDRYIVRLAAENDGVIVSNDNFRDLTKENPEWKKVIDERLLMYAFVKDAFMPPDDPLGRHGPSLDKFLCKGTFSKPKPCPYMKKCTYGNKCKYYHPEKSSNDIVSKDKDLGKRSVQESANQNHTLPISKQQPNQIEEQDLKNAANIESSVPLKSGVGSVDLLTNQEQQSCDSTQPDNAPPVVNELQAQLEEVLPGQKEKISQVLKDNPKETSLDKLINLILPN